jgi:hypothetical protein
MNYGVLIRGSGKGKRELELPGDIIEIKGQIMEILANLMQMSLISLQEQLRFRFSSASGCVNEEISVVVEEDESK